MILESAILHGFEALSEVPSEQLTWLYNECSLLELSDGQLLCSPEEELTGTYFIFSGSCAVCRYQAGIKHEIGVLYSGEITGYLPYSRSYRTSVHIFAKERVKVLVLPLSKTTDMIASHYELTQALVHVMCNRIRYMTSFQLQNEKMTALGKLSAGITHEINNPAAANVRGAAEILNYLRSIPSDIGTLTNRLREDKKRETVVLKLKELEDKVEDERSISLKERTVLELGITEWLEDEGQEDCDELAEKFAEFGVGVDGLKDLSAHFVGNDLCWVLNWIGAFLEAQRTALNIRGASRRISELVQSVKSYTHMDRGTDRQFVDLHSSIMNALMLLEHKLKRLNISFIEDFGLDIPEICAFVGKLNQVWTNLIDNALDAMELTKNGVLSIITRLDKEEVTITIKDNGTGIPEDIRTLIFDPFFTTKEIGKGTGIGLEIVNMIIAQHSGSMEVASVPGNTSFTVRLPIENKQI
ncbi:ATP-binding protein [Mucilaginibacter gynuensis]|uniref:histidine kinase n=1 Tax=Mucilaginibacter gynuensis TaxID=1302236 RepID=A0ABP8G6Z3_9SPHI